MAMTGYISLTLSIYFDIIIDRAEDDNDLSESVLLGNWKKIKVYWEMSLKFIELTSMTFCISLKRSVGQKGWWSYLILLEQFCIINNEYELTVPHLSLFLFH